MKKIIIIIGILIVFVTTKAQEVYLEDLFTVEYISVRTEIRANMIVNRFFYFGMEREYIDATEEGRAIYLIEASKNEDIIVDKRIIKKRLLPKRIRRKMITIKYN